eukprot:Rhum_TRINITY_DN14431_c2_g1::Rhum_TRINITY_DN14431_c2_g1_i1::g.88551::m.88551
MEGTAAVVDTGWRVPPQGGGGSWCEALRSPTGQHIARVLPGGRLAVERASGGGESAVLETHAPVTDVSEVLWTGPVAVEGRLYEHVHVRHACVLLCDAAASPAPPSSGGGVVDDEDDDDAAADTFSRRTLFRPRAACVVKYTFRTDLRDSDDGVWYVGETALRLPPRHPLSVPRVPIPSSSGGGGGGGG